MVRSYQEIHIPEKNFIVKSYLTGKNLNGIQQNQHLCTFTLLDMTIFCCQGVNVDKSPDDVYLRGTD